MSENKVFMCEHCGKKFPNESELVNHQSLLNTTRDKINIGITVQIVQKQGNSRTN